MTGRHLPDLKELIQLGALTEDMATLLGNLTHSGASILVSGTTGAGKTSVVNALVRCLPEDHRIILAEDSLEIQLPEERASVSMHPTADISMVHLLTLAWRMRADALVLSEVRRETTPTLLENFLVDQLLTTFHASELTTVVSHLSNEARYHADLTEAETLKLFASRFGVIVHVERYEDGSRRVSAIAEVLPSPSTEGGSRQLDLNILWSFETTGVDEEGTVQGVFVERTQPSDTLLDRLRLDSENYLTLEELTARNNPAGQAD